MVSQGKRNRSGLSLHEWQEIFVHLRAFLPSLIHCKRCVTNVNLDRSRMIRPHLLTSRNAHSVSRRSVRGNDPQRRKAVQAMPTIPIASSTKLPGSGTDVAFRLSPVPGV